MNNIRFTRGCCLVCARRNKLFYDNVVLYRSLFSLFQLYANIVNCCMGLYSMCNIVFVCFFSPDFCWGMYTNESRVKLKINFEFLLTKKYDEKIKFIVCNYFKWLSEGIKYLQRKIQFSKGIEISLLNKITG